MYKRSLVPCLCRIVALVGCDQKKGGETKPAPSAAEPSGPKADEMKLPSDLGKPKIPEDNPQTDAKVKLGHQLFFDKRLSVDGSKACYSCHTNEDGNGGKDPV